MLAWRDGFERHDTSEPIEAEQQQGVRGTKVDGSGERSFAALALLATRFRLLCVVGATPVDPKARRDAEAQEERVLLALAMRPATSDREYAVKRSLFASMPSRREDNLSALLDAALDADAARLRASRRSLHRETAVGPAR